MILTKVDHARGVSYIHRKKIIKVHINGLTEMVTAQKKSQKLQNPKKI